MSAASVARGKPKAIGPALRVRYAATIMITLRKIAVTSTNKPRSKSIPPINSPYATIVVKNPGIPSCEKLKIVGPRLETFNHPAKIKITAKIIRVTNSVAPELSLKFIFFICAQV